MNEKKIDPLHEIEKITQSVEKDVQRVSRNAFAKYPLTFSLLSTFGIAAVFYGFERTIAIVPIVGDKPFLILLLGILALMVSGGLYKKLSR